MDKNDYDRFARAYSDDAEHNASTRFTNVRNRCV